MITTEILRISIVIPVYNEADHLRACLQAIALQTVEPLEVIVVDNNSTDGSASIASSFPFVRLLHESKQGVVHARNRGFNAARGEIIGRIDADSLLPPDWTAGIEQAFADRKLAAVSGAPHYYDFMLDRIADRLDDYARRYLADRLADRNFLYGANMALRSSAWRAVRSHLCAQTGMHEDFDLAIHLQELGYRVGYNSRIVAGVSARRINSNFIDFMRYTLVSPQTYAQHQLYAAGRAMYPVVLLVWVAHLPCKIINRGYDVDRDEFSLTKFFQTFTPVNRVDPTTNTV